MSLEDLKQRPEPTTLHVRAMPPHLKAQFKDYCQRHGYTLQNAIMALMRRTVREDRPIPAAKHKPRIGG